MESGRDTVKTITANFRGVTYDLNNAVSRVEAVMGDLDAGLNEYKFACDQIRRLAEEKFQDRKTALAQEAL